MTTMKEPAATTTGKMSLAEVLAVFTCGATQSLRFTAYDGSSAGAETARLSRSPVLWRRSTFG